MHTGYVKVRECLKNWVSLKEIFILNFCSGSTDCTFIPFPYLSENNMHVQESKLGDHEYDEL